MEIKDKIFIAGHRGLLGSAIVRRLQREKYENLVTASSDELDLRDTRKTQSFFLPRSPTMSF